MSSSRFIVLKLKDIIKAFAFILAAVILIVILVCFLNKAVSKESLYSPGTYTSIITFGEEDITVSVSVNKYKISSINISEPSDTVAVFYPLFDKAAADVSQKVLDNQSLDIDLSEDNPVTESLILDAIDQCISLAKGENF